MRKTLFIILFLTLQSCASNPSNYDEHYRGLLKTSEYKESCDLYLQVANSFGLDIAESVADQTGGSSKGMNRMCIDLYLTEYLTPYNAKRLKPEGYIIQDKPKNDIPINNSFLKELGEWTELIFGVIVLIAESETYSSSNYTPSYELQDYGYDYREKISFDKKYNVTKSSKGSLYVYEPSYGSGFQIIENGNDYFYRDVFGNLNDLNVDYLESDTFGGKKVFRDPYTSKKIILKQNKYYDYSIEFFD